MKMKSISKFRLVAWGGVFTAIIVLTAIVGSALSFIDILTYLAVTPIIISVIMGGMVFGIQVSIAATILIVAILGPLPFGLYFVLSTIPPGLVVGELFRRSAKTSVILLSSTFLLAISLFLTSWAFASLMGVSLDQDILEFSNMMHYDPALVKRTLYLFFPSILLISGLVYSVYIWFFNSWILNRLKLIERNYINDIFSLLRFPAWFAYVILGSFILYILALKIHSDLFLSISGNIFFLFLFLFYFKGMFDAKRLAAPFVKNKFILFLIGLFLFFAMPVTVFIAFYTTLIDATFKERR